jgi:hypothetical protein
LDIVKLLLHHKADPNIQGENVFCFKWTWNSKILQGGCYGNPLQAAALGHKDIVELLLNHGADPNIQGENVLCFKWTWHSKILQGGRYGTPLQAAAAYWREHKDIVELLLKHGADPGIQGENVFLL